MPLGNVGIDMMTEGDTCNARSVSGTSAAVHAIKRPLEESAKMGDRNSASSVDKAPAKTPTSRRTSIRARAGGVVDKKAVNKLLPLCSDTGRSGGPGGV